MRLSVLTSFLIASLLGFSQPDPRIGYPDRIAAITEQLKSDSLNYSLIWERLEMRINLMGNRISTYEVNSLASDSIQELTEIDPYIQEIDADFEKIFSNVIEKKNFKEIEEGDFYLNRLWFNSSRHRIEDALSDAIYLRDSASYSQYWERGEYYYDWAQYSLLDLYIAKGQYEEAFETITTMLAQRQKADPKLYYVGAGMFFGQRDKINLLVYFEKHAEVISFLKETCGEHFAWYFEKAKLKDAELDSWRLADNEYYMAKSSYLYFMGAAKDQSFHLLKQLIGYMREYQDEDLSKFEAVYNKIRFQRNENFETINPDISDERLQEIVSGIFK